MGIVNTQLLAKHLIERGLMPTNCRLIDVTFGPQDQALTLRYERFVNGEELGKFAEAIKAVADDMAADDERNRKAREVLRP